MNSDINASVATPAVVTPKSTAQILPTLNTALPAPAKTRSPRPTRKQATPASFVPSAK